MTGLGLILLQIGYAVVYWGLQAIQGNSQDSFVSYVLPFASKYPTMPAPTSPAKSSSSSGNNSGAGSQSSPPPRTEQGTGTGKRVQRRGA